MWAHLLDRVLARSISLGRLEVTYPDGKTRHYGLDDSGPSARIALTDSKILSRLLVSPQMALGEGYMNGSVAFPCEADIRRFLQLAVRNRNAGAFPLPMRLARRMHIATRRFMQWNSLSVARRRVRHHYEYPAEFYDLFLGADLQYTCGFFPSDDLTIDGAQQEKMRLIARKLCLRPGQRVLDIGCGWGGLALYLAREHDVRVTGITLSDTQLKVARDRAAAEGLSDRVTFELRDYRDVTAQFDRVVSVGMMEHVGIPQYRGFFSGLDRMLAPDGLALVHFIGRSTPPGVLSPWFQKYIFPGGYSPALSEVMPHVETSGLVMTDLEVWRGHYERTLQCWQQRFGANENEVRRMFGERFVRMWRWYLIAAEVSFSDMGHVVFQMQLAPKASSAPRTRDYIYRPGGA